MKKRIRIKNKFRRTYSMISSLSRDFIHGDTFLLNNFKYKVHKNINGLIYCFKI